MDSSSNDLGIFLKEFGLLQLIWGYFIVGSIVLSIILVID